MDKDKIFSHVDSQGKINMVNVGDKNICKRKAKAVGKIILSQETFSKIQENSLNKGDVLTTAKLAGILGAKKTSELIPLAHNILIDKVTVDLNLISEENSIEITSWCYSTGKTGIEMEALTAVAITALTIYDMTKAVDPWSIISDIKMEEKDGGKNGLMIRPFRE